MKSRDILFVVLATLVGAWYRFDTLGRAPFWIDEVLYVWMCNGTWASMQEFVPVLLGKTFSLDGEFWVRFPFALAGTLTIPAMYHVTKESGWGVYFAAFVAVFPLFVFWSRMARPYAFAGLFLVLGWRYWWSYFIAILTTPAAFVGINFKKIREKKFILIYASLLAVALVSYFLRSDVSGGKSFLDLNLFLTTRRFLYVPILALCLYLADYLRVHRFVNDPE